MHCRMKQCFDALEGRRALQRQPRAVARPAVEGKEFSPALVLLAEVLWHAAAHLRQRTAHDLAEIALFKKKRHLLVNSAFCGGCIDDPCRNRTGME
jgi:hypothetical protein